MKRIALFFAALLAYAGMALAAVNINSATKEQLETLDGIGPVKAQAIIDYRTRNGRFKALEDLKKVEGIGEATFEKVRSKVSLTGTTTVAAPDAKAQPQDAKTPVQQKMAADAEKKKALEEKRAAAATAAAAEKKKADEKQGAADKKKAADEKKKPADEKKKADEKQGAADKKKAADEKKGADEKKVEPKK